MKLVGIGISVVAETTRQQGEYKTVILWDQSEITEFATCETLLCLVGDNSANILRGLNLPGDQGWEFVTISHNPQGYDIYHIFMGPRDRGTRGGKEDARILSYALSGSMYSVSDYNRSGFCGASSFRIRILCLEELILGTDIIHHQIEKFFKMVLLVLCYNFEVGNLLEMGESNKLGLWPRVNRYEIIVSIHRGKVAIFLFNPKLILTTFSIQATETIK